MAEKGFWDLQRAVFRLHGERRYEEALAAAAAAAGRFPEEGAKTRFWVACLESRLGRCDEAVRTLEEGVAGGLWWSERMLSEDPDLASLQEREDFQALVRECERRHRAAEAKLYADLVVLTPEGFPRDRLLPALLALHAREGNAAACAATFRPALSMGLVVAAPQGTQLSSERLFSWDDRERAKREVLAAYEKLLAGYPVDPARVVLAGVSQGAAVALCLALSGRIPRSRGFVAVIPSVIGVEACLPRAPEAARRGLRGWILVGEKDPRCERVRTLHQNLIQAGLPCELVVEEGLGHEIPDDFAERLQAAIGSLLGADGLQG